MKAPRLPFASRRPHRAVAAVLGAVGVASCTLLGSRDIVQCRQDGDCSVSPLPNAVCVQGLCVSSSSGTTDDVFTPSPPDARSDVADDVSEPAPSCQTTEDCESSPPHLCVRGSCVRVTDPNATHGCVELFPSGTAYRAPEAQLVGVYATVGGSFGDSPGVGAVRLALTEINAATTRLVALVCRKENGKPGEVVDHLSKLGVPLVVGQFETSELQTIATHAPSRRVAVWSTLGNSSALQLVDSQGHLSFFADELARTSAAFQEALDVMEQRKNPLVPVDAGEDDAGDAEPPPPTRLDGPTRVALLQLDDGDTEPLWTALNATLRINGKSLDENATASTPTFKRYVIRVGESPPPEIYQFFHPHVIIAIGGDPIIDAIKKLEEVSTDKSLYVLSSRSKFPLSGKDMFTALPDLHEKRSRFIGVDFSGDKARHTTYLQELASRKFPLTGASFDMLYDALYVAALARYVPLEDGGAPGLPLTSADFIRGLDAFRDPDASTTISAGPADFALGQSQLTGGARVRFRGVTGEWVFEQRTRRMGTSFWCYKPAVPPELTYYNRNAADAGCQPPP